VPARADDQYVKELFDGFASSFDENLASLGYRAPELLSSALGEYVPTDGRLDILDAGCGTGLCGPLLRSTANRLLGVDISDGMVTKARERNVYDELVVAELCEFMRSRPASVDVILSADTLVYFGALEEACAAARQCLRPNGLFAFTVERLEQAVDNTAVDSSQGAPPDIQPPLSFHLQPHGRYAHSATYVESTLRQAGFAEVHRRDVVLRRELGHDVHGHLVVGRVS
jgi:predicted TPR repeat methyltransferase